MTLPRRKPSKNRMQTRSNDRVCHGHRKWIRGHVCLVDGADCVDRIEAHHIREGQTGGMGLKPDDGWLVPLCADHHAEFHRIGRDTFQSRYGLDLTKTAERLAAMSPHLRKRERNG